MSAILDCSDRLAELEEALAEVRVQARAVQLATIGPNLYAVGYGWCEYDAWKEERARRRVRDERHIAAADLSPTSILTATMEAAAACGGEVQARDVALVVMPEAAAPDTPGRQILIARVGKQMRELVGQGKLVRVSAPEGRRTSRYALAGGAGNAR